MNSPYLIEIVPADRGWILEKMAQVIERESRNEGKRFNVRVVDQPSDSAELTFFLPASAYKPLERSTTVTYLAHREDDKRAAKLFDDVARKSDYCITSSRKYQRVIEEAGAKKVFRIPLGVDTELFIPKLRIGVVGRTYHTGRKGEALLAELVGMPMVELLFTGSGWPYPSGYYENKDLAEFYQEIDYLLIPSLIEGGPVPLLEALASGCPVISPSDIGFVEDFPHIPFKRGDAKDLRSVVERLLAEKLALRDSIKGEDWRDFARKHLELFAELIEQRRKTRRSTIQAADSQVIDDDLGVLLVTHGIEETTKGGPSTRVRFIQNRLQQDGYRVKICHNIESVQQLEGIDVVHVFNYWPPHSAMRSMALAKKAGKKVILSVIALDLGEWPIYRQLMEVVFSHRNSELTESVIRQLPMVSKSKKYIGPGADVPIEGIPQHFEALRQCCASADYLIFLSEQERGFLSSLGARTEHGRLIRNGVSDVFDNKADPGLFRRRSGLDRYILCVGRLEYRKNQALLALAARDIDIPLVLIGDEGEDGYLEHVRMLGGDNLHYYRRIEDKELLASAYAGATVFVLPSWAEGAPLAALEAGLTGVPLVLSDRSAEKEYFGDDADYVSPADPIAIRDALRRVIEKAESPNIRSARGARLKERYSESIHVNDTLAFYRTVAEETLHGCTSKDLVIDVSSLLHSLRVGGHLTGVPLAERMIVAELMKLQPTAKCIAYHGKKGCFIEVRYSDLENFNPDIFSRDDLHADEAGAEYDLRLKLNLAHVPEPPVILRRSDSIVGERREAWRARIVFILTRLGIPKGILRRLMRSVKAGLSEISIIRKDRDRNGITDYSNIHQYIKKIRVPRPSLGITPGSRILTLGQGWISNENLLNSLLDLAAAGCSLEAYVYDISYVSGAHLSGWADNDVRQRRLNKLLTQCSTVFTESKISATELVKYGNSRSMSYKVVRTGLRGKEFSPQMSGERLRNAGPFVLYLSSFNRRKNHDFIIQVWKDLMLTVNPVSEQGVKLFLVGKIQGETKYSSPEYRRELSQFNIEVISDADDRTVAGFYADCKFTVFPSLQEGWGLPVQESLMNGKICLTSNTVPAAQEIQNAALVKLAPNDFFGWREAIITWLKNDNMRKAFEEKALCYKPPSWADIAKTIYNGKN